MATCNYCKGRGKAYSRILKRYVTCDGCAGTGRTGWDKCGYCNGTGKDYKAELNRYVTCDGCRGSGRKR